MPADSKTRSVLWNRWSPLGGRGLEFVLLLLFHTCVANLQQNTAAVLTTTVPHEDAQIVAAVVHKCCGRSEILVVNKCRAVNDTKTAAWSPEFTASDQDDATAGQRTLPATSVPHK